MTQPTPHERPGLLIRALSVLGGLASILWLANLKVFPPEIPDMLPGVGNVDEFLASALLLWSARNLGITPRSLWRARRKSPELNAPELNAPER